VQVRTRGELKRALETAAAERGRFQLIDVRIAPGEVSRRMRAFAGRLSKGC
jgi:thiamine pyrophosphate-dependent acetolactate synthase large subunit-like protein